MASGVSVILCQDIATLGKVGDKVSVKTGYALNFLIPQNKAILLTAENEKIFEQQRAEHEKQAIESKKQAQVQADEVNGTVIEYTVKTSADGKLFGSVTVRDVIRLLTEKGINIGKQNIRLVGGNIHHVGDYKIELTFYAGVIAVVELRVLSNHPEYTPEEVVQDEATVPEEAEASEEQDSTE